MDQWWEHLRQHSSEPLVSAQEWESLVVQFPYPSAPDKGEENPPEEVAEKPSEAGNVSSLDPLSAIVQEQRELQEREAAVEAKFRQSRHKKIVAEESVDERSVDWEIIQRDLRRLPKLHFQNTLEQVLWIYTNTHDLTYQQGMHEIAYTLASEESTDTLRVYHLLCMIISQISDSYDYSSTQSYEQPLQACSRRVLQGCQQYDPQLVQLLTSIGVPPQLYLTQWMRLLFRREVTPDKVVDVWNILLRRPLQKAVEAAAVARLLYARKTLLTSASPLNDLMNMPAHDGLDWLQEFDAIVEGQPLKRPLAVIVTPSTARPSTAAPPPPPTTIAPSSPSFLPDWQSKFQQATIKAKEKTQKFIAQFDQPQDEQHGPRDTNIYNLQGRHGTDPQPAPYNLQGRQDVRRTSPTMVLQNYLQDLERKQGIVVPTHVWQALGSIQGK